MEPLLSVIIPVYNCAPVINRCLESIDYPDAEIIVVDDGSTDDSAKVVAKYAETHPNILLFRKENGGVSSARNMGIEKATGKYLMFVDADDYLVPGGISKIVELAEIEEADVVKYRLVGVANETPQVFDSLQCFQLKCESIIGEGSPLMRYDISDYHVVDALFRLSLIIDNGICFYSELSLREDDVFMGMIYCHARKTIVTDLPLYRYVTSSFYSSTHNQSVSKQRKLIDSGYMAARYRSEYVSKFCPEVMPLERLKYMRWVCQPKTALAAGYSLGEYRDILRRFEELCCWPLDYNWMHVARLDWSWKIRMKNRVKTFLCNHPWLAYQILRK